MSKEKMTARDILARHQENVHRIAEIADACEKENRARTEAEETEYRSLCQQNDILRMRMQTIAMEQCGEQSNERNMAEANKILRENVAAGRQTQIVITRSNDPSGSGKLMMIADAASGGIIPVKIQDIVRPIQEKLIYDKIGIQIKTGLAGDYLWPTYEAVEATLVGEGVRLGDTEISLNKLTPKVERMGLAIPVTREAINQSEGVIETIVRETMPAAITRLVNKILMKPAKVVSTTQLTSPFVALNTTTTPKMGLEPTFKDFVTMKGALLDEGIEEDSLVWTMTASQKAIAEATPKDAGSGIMVCENNRIAGIPVFTTSEMQGFIGLGAWRYQVAGFFGDMTFIVDPYSQARKNAVDFVLNLDFGTATLAQKAFKLGKVAAKAQ